MVDSPSVTYFINKVIFDWSGRNRYTLIVDSCSVEKIFVMYRGEETRARILSLKSSFAF